MKIFNEPRYIRLVREGSWTAIGQIASVSGTLILIRLLTEYINPAQYGQLSLGLTIAGLVNNLVMGGISNGIGRYYSIALEKKDISGYLKASTQIMVYATLVVAFIGALILIGLLTYGYKQWSGLAIAALVFSVLSGYSGAFSGIQNAARQRKIVAFHGGLDSWLKVLLSAVILIWIGTEISAIIIGYIIATLLVNISQIYFLRQVNSDVNRSTIHSNTWLRQIWAYSWPYSTWGVFTWMQQVSDRWALERWGSADDVGMYTVLFQLSYGPIGLITTALMSFLSPIFYSRMGDATNNQRVLDTKRLTFNLTVVCIVVTMVAAFCGWMFHDIFFKILANERYREISYLLPWMIIAGGFMSGYHILGSRISSALETRSVIKSQVVTAVLAVAANCLGASLFGLRGIVFSLVAYSSTFFVWMYFISGRVLDKKVAPRQFS